MNSNKQALEKEVLVDLEVDSIHLVLPSGAISVVVRVKHKEGQMLDLEILKIYLRSLNRSFQWGMINKREEVRNKEKQKEKTLM